MRLWRPPTKAPTTQQSMALQVSGVLISLKLYQSMGYCAGVDVTLGEDQPIIPRVSSTPIAACMNLCMKSAPQTLKTYTPVDHQSAGSVMALQKIISPK